MHLGVTGLSVETVAVLLVLSVRNAVILEGEATRNVVVAMAVGREAVPVVVVDLMGANRAAGVSRAAVVGDPKAGTGNRHRHPVFGEGRGSHRLLRRSHL